jgi:GTP cyclohydrolase IA
MNEEDGVDPIEALVAKMLGALGEDPGREGLLRTPGRVARSMRFLTEGYHLDPIEILNNAVFEESYDEMVLVKDIEFYSLCEHHMLPFFGRCHIGYLPSGRVFGVSKLARLVDVFARRLQLQERLTEQISRAIMDAIEPVGVGVMMEAQHLCMMMRGVEKQRAVMTTSSLLGSFRENATTRQEFLALINRPRP